jgi:hypothetical protein
MENILQSHRNLITPLPQQNEEDERDQNPKLTTILSRIDRLNRFRELADAQVTDLWLPMPKGLAQKLLGDEDTQSFLIVQERCLDDKTKLKMMGEHLNLADSYFLGFQEVKLLGVGGFAEVHEVFHPQTGNGYARKVMQRPVKFQRHCDLLKQFKKELNGLLKVKHQHCVTLAASCTDMDSVILYTSPIAECDLTNFLDSELGDSGMVVLRHSIGCIVSALTYLHQAGIRYHAQTPSHITIRLTPKDITTSSQTTY